MWSGTPLLTVLRFGPACKLSFGRVSWILREGPGMVPGGWALGRDGVCSCGAGHLSCNAALSAREQGGEWVRFVVPMELSVGLSCAHMVWDAITYGAALWACQLVVVRPRVMDLTRRVANGFWLWSPWRNCCTCWCSRTKSRTVLRSALPHGFGLLSLWPSWYCLYLHAAVCPCMRQQQQQQQVSSSVLVGCRSCSLGLAGGHGRVQRCSSVSGALGAVAVLAAAALGAVAVAGAPAAVAVVACAALGAAAVMCMAVVMQWTSPRPGLTLRTPLACDRACAVAAGGFTAVLRARGERWLALVCPTTVLAAPPGSARNLVEGAQPCSL